MEISQRIENNHICVVSVDGRISMGENTEALRNCFETVIQDDAIEALIINLQKVTFIDSSGLGIITTLLERLRKQDRKLALCNLTLNIQDLFFVSGLNNLLTIHPTEKEALAALIA